MRRLLLYAIDHKGKIYTRTFCALLAMSICVVSVFYVSLNRMFVRHHREQIATTNLDYLRLSASSLDVTFSVLSRSMTQALWHQDFIAYMINPATVDQEMYYRISQRLRQDVSSVELISCAYFFSPLSDVVFRNGNPVMSKSDLPDRDILEAFERSEHSAALNEARTSTELFFYEGRLFLFQELNIASHIGTMVYELNQQAIRDRLLAVSTPGDVVLVFDENRHPMFLPAEETAEVDWQNWDCFITPGNVNSRYASVTSGWYLYRNELGWCFMLPIDSESLRISWTQVLTSYLPVFLCLLGICFLLSWYITRVLYYPINHLMRLVMPAPGSAVRAKSETDILESAYHTALEEQSQLRGIVSNIAPEIQESMLKNLLIGKHLTQERVTEILRSIGDPISANGQFLVLGCHLAFVGDAQLDDTEFNLYLLTVRRLIQQLQDVSCTIYDIHADVMMIALICCFPEDTPLPRIALDAKSILQTLRLNAEGMPFRLFCARGKVYHSLLDVRYSYREAMERVKYQEYLFFTGDSEGEAPAEADEETALATDQDRIKARAKEIMDHAARDEQAQAEALLERTLDEIGRQTADGDPCRSALQMLRDEMLERVITYPLTEEDQYLLTHRGASAETAGGWSREEHLRLLRADARDMFRMVLTYGQKNRYRYIEQAKQYITENYMDSNLSLSSVGDHVGISSSYLSELWSEVTHEKFSSYLAAFRVEKAQQLLRTTTLTVKEIGFRCGFNSAQNFIRVYKKYTGISPGQLRERLQHPEVP
ncbi:MAG: helix-turn-helix domain-containing protein [Ruminococcaceae bacterium]|nr:helix-turn-helix domain-containing protein [Oscillospiraceae bacterium]